MNAAVLAARMLARDWRAGELRILALALIVAVASVTSVGFLADRIGRALVRDAVQLLGADLVFTADHPWSGAVPEEIARRGLARAEAVSFISMAQAGSGTDARSQLAGVKAVSGNYPLRGRLRIAPAPGAPDAQATAAPARGVVWIEERLVSALNAPVGTTLQLGDASFTVGAVLTLEPERSTSFFNIAPRLLLHIDDLPATGLIQTGSRVWYTLYAAGDAERIAAFETWAKDRLGRGERMEDLENGRPDIRAAIERAQRFLGLTALLAAILAGVAISLGARRFVERHLDGCAVMRCFGATQRKLVSLYGLEFLFLGVTASALGCSVGALAQTVMVQTLAALLQTALPAPGILPAVQGILVGLVLLLGFALPPLMQLKNVPAVRVIRRESGVVRAGAVAVYGAGFAALAALFFWQAGDAKLAATVTVGFLVAVAVYAAIGWVVLRAVAGGALGRMIGRRNPALRYGLANLRRHLKGNAVQVASLAVGLTALLLLSFTRDDLIEAWRRAAPPDAPNRFVIGVQPEQLAPVRQFFAERGIAAPDLYPMVRGRLTTVNGRAVSERDYADERAKRLVEREFNLSYSEDMPAHNRIASGRWFGGAGDAPEVSVEEGIAKTLGWKLGDELRFAVGDTGFSARITSLRSLRWDSMKVNFFVIAPPAVMRDMPASFISAFRVEPKDEAAVGALAQRFPNLTLVDVGAALKQVSGMVDQLVTAVQFIFFFGLAAGVLVLYSALVATEDERRREAAVMRVYGASRAQVTGSQRVEFLAMGILAGVLATAGAAAIGQAVARRLFDLDLPPSAMLLVVGPLAGVALLSLNAWLSSRKVLRVSPALTLRDGN